MTNLSVEMYLKNMLAHSILNPLKIDGWQELRSREQDLERHQKEPFQYVLSKIFNHKSSILFRWQMSNK